MYDVILTFVHMVGWSTLVDNHVDSNQRDAPGLLWSQSCGGGDHLEYPTVWHMTGHQDVAAIDDFYVPALCSVISPVKVSNLTCQGLKCYLRYKVPRGNDGNI